MKKNNSVKLYIKKKQISTICAVLLLVFIGAISICASNWNSRLSLAFTAIASLSTVATLIIAVRLFDRFGLKNEFVVKQAEKIFSLFDILLEQTILAHGTGMEVMIRANLEQLMFFHQEERFLAEAPKKLFFSRENFDDFYKKINPVRQSYWLPREIQESLDFLMFSLVGGDDYDPDIHIKLSFSGPVGPKDYQLLAYPDQTLGEFVKNMINLIEQIDKWLKKHSEVEIALATRY